MLICCGDFLGFSQPKSFSAKGIDVGGACASCTFAGVFCFGDACTLSAYAGGTCTKSACTGIADAKSTCIRLLCTKGACIKSTFAVGACAWRARSFTKGTYT